ncbi:type I-B CRISPR-associated protein Cas8b1/Cst1 [Ruminococcus sp. AF41-9]|nr:type I-B CRISPR-associated protein Cas8b1/Cst1 [Ruminococcus sp. AF41-9]
MESLKSYIREGDDFLDKYVITLGDFLKNAGIVGFRYMLESAEAKENVDFGITEDGQGLWLDMNFALIADWTDMYFKACVQYFGPSTVYQGVLDRIERCLDKIQTGKWNPGKEEKEDLKFISDKLLSNSYQAGFENIKNGIDMPEVYQTLKKDKLNDKLETEKLEERLIELEKFLQHPKCRETFIMKSVVYTYINRFWSGKCFLLRANAKKDMRELFEKDFSEPFRKYLEADHKKAKDLCIDCGMPIGPKEKNSIAFMNEVGDDFTRKRSAFWDCKADAFLCPGCTFVYALSPLGFRLFANKFVFVNLNNNIRALLESNSKTDKDSANSEKAEGEKYSQWFAKTINILLKEKMQEISNIQVILRGIRAEDRYLLGIVHKSMLDIIKVSSVSKALQLLGKFPYVKIRNEFVNVHETAVINLLQYRNQYQLLNQLLKAAIEDDAFNFYANWIYEIQLQSEIIYFIEEEKRKEIAMYTSMKRSGSDLRKAIMVSKGESSGDCLRGIEYQLLNALSVRNVDKFMDVVLRLYSSYGSQKNEKGQQLLVPTGLVQMLGDQEKFTRYGYAFVMGLEGCYEKKEDKQS